ncbi:C-Maf-inducing protein-like isoform X2 [Macrobrachium nipponense]|uniref:C-Maf-inducing protein-like isoform X2 n=1 Tax=Macrobrachium nipponense TaxID=159736 RepID=UPI0030C81BE1
MLTALSGGYYTSPTRPMPPTPPRIAATAAAAAASNGIPAGGGPLPPPLLPPLTPSSSSSSSPRSLLPQLQYCDTCNTACVFMNGKRRKFQARYEGYVLVKRVPTRPYLPYVMAAGQQQQLVQQPQQQQQQQQNPAYLRRHSCGGMLDEDGVDPLEGEAGGSSSYDASSSSSSSSPPGGENHHHHHHHHHHHQTPESVSPPAAPASSASYGRSLSHSPEWRQDDTTTTPSPSPLPTPPPLTPPTSGWEKVMNVDDDDDDEEGSVVINGAALPRSAQHSATDLRGAGVGGGGGGGGRESSGGGGESSGGGRKPRRHSAMMERLSGGHQRLCRKKSRSQDNLVGGRRGSGCLGGGGGGPLRLNNSVIPPPSSLTSALSRSEGSIHNVHAVLTAVPITVDDVDVGFGAIRAEVGELARLPKRLLHRVTGEVGQLVFDLEGWREEYLLLTHTAIATRTANGFTEGIVPYSQIEDVHVVVPCGTSGHKFCVRVVVRDGALLLQATNSYARDQWLHSIIWKKNVYKYRNVLRTAKRPEVLLKELKNLVELSLATPLHDHTVCRVPLELASSILTTGEKWLSRQMTEEIIVTLAPLLENNQPSPEICQFFSQHCTDNPRSCLVIDMFTPIIKRILKHNVDFGKYPYVRRFVQNYIQALNSQNDGRRVVHQFVDSMHGPTSTCPHLRVLPNLVSVCTAAVCGLLEDHRSQERLNTLHHHSNEDTAQHLNCYLSVLSKICEYDDWRPGLAQLLQPIPFPDVALADEEFIRQIMPVVEMIGTDPRCDVHQMVLGTREDKEGWLSVICPSSLACVDEGSAWAAILQTLISCCCKRKKFLGSLVKSLGACMLLALRGNITAQDVLCLMLEWELIDGADQSLQVVTTLQSTPTGKRRYQALCDHQMHLRELKGGPRKLTLPSRSTDADVNRMLSSGSFGNLECLSLAFTRVTSACAEQLIKLPTLRYLNLWATQFGDVGLQLISEHLHKLQVLNLCETPVTDKGLGSLAAIKSLRKLNLNSTSLSVETFETLKEMLPGLQEVDVRYTDAW